MRPTSTESNVALCYVPRDSSFSRGTFEKAPLIHLFISEMDYLLIIFMIVSKSLQYTNVVEEEKYCECYDRCHRNFTTNAVTDERLKAACERGCRFYSLVLHASTDLYSAVDKTHTKEGCIISCIESYTALSDVSACKFGCSSMISTDSDICSVIGHGSFNVIEFLFDDSKTVIHLEEPEPDEVLVDVALKKQFENSIGMMLNPKQKLPEIFFRNLPAASEVETSGQHSGGGIIRCPRLYELYVKLALRHRALTSTDIYFLFGVLILAVTCFLVSRYLEKNRKLWKQMLVNVIKKKTVIARFGDDDEESGGNPSSSERRKM